MVRDVADLLAEGLVHLLVDPLRLDRHVVEVGTPQHGPLALGALLGPGAAVGQPPGRLALPGDLDEPLEGQAGVGDDAVVRGEDPADLGGLDVDVDEACARAGRSPGRRCGGWPSGCRCRARSRRRAGWRCRTGGGLEPGHAGHQPVVVRDGPPAHQGRDRPARPTSSANSTSRSAASALTIPPPATISGRSAAVEHVQRLLDLGPGRRRPVDGQRLVGVDVEVDLGQLHVEGQVDQHRARPAGAHQVERLLERARAPGPAPARSWPAW